VTRVLVVDDDPGVRRSLALLLGEAGYAVDAEGDPARVLGRATAGTYDLILCDLRMPGLEGRELLRRYRAAGGSALLVMMGSDGSGEATLDAMREGAYDYLHKPFRPDEVLFRIRVAVERERLRNEVAELRAAVATGGSGLVAESAAMRRVIERAARVAGHATTVLVTGESGTGKELVARFIHQRSPRAAARFVAVNCAAIPESLMESELFGHRRGASTGATEDRRGLFEEADGGTLLLDEVGDLPLAFQSKLVRALEEGAIRRVGEDQDRQLDVRVIAATARELDALVRDGRFRDDLYYRLNVVQLHLPPLRERPEDIPALAAQFLAQTAARQGRSLSLTSRALARLREYPWPGNVRELRNALERAAVLAGSATLDAADLALGDPRATAAGGGVTRPLKAQVESLERTVIERALHDAGGNRRDAAKLLRISLRTLFYKLRRYGLG
jgi:DNA-binding NtrC family response regulator